VARAAPHIPAPHAQPSVVQLCINDMSTSPSHLSTPLPRSRLPGRRRHRNLFTKVFSIHRHRFCNQDPSLVVMEPPTLWPT
jgi:hypothetical protein